MYFFSAVLSSILWRLVIDFICTILGRILQGKTDFGEMKRSYIIEVGNNGQPGNYTMQRTKL